MNQQKIKLLSIVFLLVPLLSYASQDSVDNSQQELVPVSQIKEDVFLGKLKGFTKSFKDNGGYLDLGLGVGYMNGRVTLDFNHHVSILEYPLNNMMGGGKISLGYKRFSLNTEAWGSLTDNAGWNMWDRDWDDGELISSTLSDTDVNAMILDGNVRYDFLDYAFSETKDKQIFKPSNIKVGAMIGYRYQRFGFNMYGLRDSMNETTTNEGEEVLAYKIKYYLPYCGLALDTGNDKFNISLGAKYSFKPHVKDQDDHLLRDVGDRTFYGDYKDNSNVFMANAVMSWKFFKNWQANFGADAALIRIRGAVAEENNDPKWSKDQFSKTTQFMYWLGLGYRF